LFADLEAAFRERAGEVTNHSHVQPTLGEVAITLRRHLVLLTEFLGDEGHASRDIRKHMAWYFKGYPVGELRAQFAQVTSLAHLDDLIVQLDLDAPYPGQDAEGQRGRQGTPKKPTLPHRWLDSQELSAAEQCVVSEAEIDASGG
jgi:hypothetical protein